MSIPNYMVYAHGRQHCNPRSVNLGNTLVIMNCDNSVLNLSLENYYQMMIFATSISDMNMNNIEDVLKKIDTLQKSFTKSGKNSGLCAYSGICPNLYLSPITGGFMAKTPFKLFWEKIPQNEISTNVLENILNERKKIISSPGAFDNPKCLSQLERLCLWGWMNQENHDQNWSKNTAPDKFFIQSEIPLGSIYKSCGNKQYLCDDESSKDGHTLHDIIQTINNYDGGAPKILFVVSCAIGETNIREFSTPVSNITCMIRKYIQNILHVSGYKIVQEAGGQTFITKGNKRYKVMFKKDKLQFLLCEI